MAYHITLLKGREWYARGNKEYAYTDNGKDIVKVSDFKLGYEYDYLPRSIESLEELCELFREVGRSGSSAIRIHGIPHPMKAFLGGPFERNKKFFHEPKDGIHLFNFDIDDWPCAPFSYDKPLSTAVSIYSALEDNGFGFLVGHRMVVLWSQSAWATDRLRCHLYMILDAPVNLEELRGWARAINRVGQKKILDGSVWVDIQPDYIGRRHCIPPLEDPLTEEHRVFVLDGGKHMLSASVLREEISKAVAAERSAESTGKIKSYDTGSKKDTWQGTIDKSGTPGHAEGDINAWGFRAAAKMVQEYGPDYIRANIKKLSEELYARAWEGIKRNSPDRGNESDGNTYNIDRYAQYLRSACDRDFGGDIDRKVAAIYDAISVAKETETFTKLLDKETLSLCAEIAGKRPAAWTEIQAAIKSELRGKISITEFRKLVKSGGEEGALGGGVPDEGRVRLIKQVLGFFDWIIDEDNNRYVGRVILDNNGMPERYELKSLGDNLENVFYHIGAQLDETVTPHFGKSCLSYILGSLHGGAPQEERARWTVKKVGQQQIFDRQGALWWRLDDATTLKIHPEQGVSKVMTDIEGAKSGVLWYAHQDVKPRRVAGVNTADYDINLLWKYVLCDSVDRPQVLGWLINCLLDAPTQMIIELIGPPGCAKSSAGSVLRDLIEPVSDNPFYFDPKERKTLVGQTRQDKYRAIKKNAVIFLDNVSGLDSDTQDFYCQLGTGVCVDLRIMYSSVMESIPLKRPIILTGLSPMITQPDLLSRSLRIRFSQKVEYRRDAIPEVQLPKSWDTDKPKILAALAEICLKALRLRAGAIGRRGSYTTIMQAIYGEELGWRQAESDYKRSQTDIVMTNPFCLAFTVFCDKQFAAKKTHILEETPGNIFIYYKKWIESNWGKHFDLRLSCGEVVTVVIETNTKGSGILPGTPGGLGTLLNKFTHEFNEVCGLIISDTAKINGIRVRQIKRKSLL